MPEPLDYATPEEPPENRGAIFLGAVLGFFMGVAGLSASLPTIPGDLTPAKILFPLPLLLGLSANGLNVVILAVVLAVVQYPLYGIVCGFGAMRGRLSRVFLAVTAFHVCCIALCTSLVSR